MAKIQIITSDDWIEVSVDDEIVFENHSFHSRDLASLLQELGHVVEEIAED